MWDEGNYETVEIREVPAFMKKKKTKRKKEKELCCAEESKKVMCEGRERR